MGVVGLILGILALIFCWIPVINWISILFAIIGIALSAVGMAKAKKANQSSGVAVAGLVLSIVAFVICLPVVLCCAAAAGAAGTGAGLLGL